MRLAKMLLVKYSKIYWCSATFFKWFLKKSKTSLVLTGFMGWSLGVGTILEVRKEKRGQNMRIDNLRLQD